jgi:hypothetical protein
VRDAGIVYMSLGQLLLRPPHRVAYHRKGRALWPVYLPIPGNEEFAERHGHEAHWTACGQLIYQSNDGPTLGLKVRRLDGIRLDNARLVGRPCWRCWA